MSLPHGLFIAKDILTQNGTGFVSTILGQTHLSKSKWPRRVIRGRADFSVADLSLL